MTSRDDLPEWDELVEQLRTPAAVVPVAAIARGGVRGLRVIVGIPGLGWRGDLRGDAPVVQGSRTYIPVLPEAEWYRAESERVEVFAPLIPVERVWVETLADAGGPPAGPDVVSRLVSLDAPPVRRPVPARDCAALTGRRMIRLPGPGDGIGTDQRDLRAVSEPYTSDTGNISVRLVTELDWYRWGWAGQAPRTLVVPLHLLWVE